MRVAIVTHQFIKGHGQGRVNYEIAHEALCRGHSVTLVATEVAPELRACSRVSWAPIPQSALPTQLARNLVFAQRGARWLRQHRRELDLVHLNGFVVWEGGEVNTSHMVHGDWLRSPMHTCRLRRDLYGLYHWIFSALNARWELQAYRQARVVVAVSERVRRQLIGIGVPPERIRVILNGVDAREFCPGPADRRVLGLPEGVPLGLFAGDLRTPLKNIDTVLRALVNVPEAHLAVVGDTQRSPYPRLAERLGLTARVHFLGYRRDMAELMRAADIFVFPSRTEACPLVMFEAMASGLPVIIARTVGAAELVTPECGVVLSDPNDAAGLACAMQTLVADPERRSAMGGAARAVAKRHSWRAMTDAYLRLYEEVS